MGIRLFNTYTRQLEEFTPLDPAGQQVKMYTCGPTVYNHAHIGNFRAYLFEDLLQRHLEARGYQVERVMNLTDVDDKTIRNSREAGRRLADFTAIYKDAFFQDVDTLRIKRAQHFPAATEPRYIERMISMIQQLESQGIAYQAEDKSVYFRLSKFPDYGKLAHLNLDELRPSGRIANDEYEKESIGDFALWKAWDEKDGDVAWDSPWGRGRPGWHIECSAMATALLGPEIDIHCGGVDNIFPHHEAEIAQSECCTGKKFVRYWLHCAHLMVDGQKMSKKLGNFYTLRDLIEKGFTGREARYALLTVNYRLPLNFTLPGLESARASLARIDEWVDRLTAHAAGASPTATPLSDFTEKFFAALDEDLNISGALAPLFDLIRESNSALNRSELSPAEAAQLLADWRRIDSVLGFEREAAAIPADVLALVEQRQQARADKEWKKSDELRDEILAKGWVVKDTKEGPKLTPR
ncbi:cysteinyl-tRNA synthetase [Chthoniobacter flavus Ellin428]|uniref:Cysteine--tRNA ligase n=1 Tax=Chthoniobacter flavus Ellin428 TaxID=497964 RepID=B4D5H7_9BACT|nr:cysteine--tRNA ligase [Chthoniobacter flavus]EDY18382.1 cysteinyl-tRNA synthetase [Chthoniobacter flavus Ellin428]TCO91402.1 cysteinyl-tRNA synthetase [Chthoniobacter flavus]